MKLSQIIERLEFIKEKRWDLDFDSIQVWQNYFDLEWDRVIYKSDTTKSWWCCLMITDDLPY